MTTTVILLRVDSLNTSNNKFIYMVGASVVTTANTSPLSVQIIMHVHN